MITQTMGVVFTISIIHLTFWLQSIILLTTMLTTRFPVETRVVRLQNIRLSAQVVMDI